MVICTKAIIPWSYMPRLLHHGYTQVIPWLYQLVIPWLLLAMAAQRISVQAAQRPAPRQDEPNEAPGCCCNGVNQSGGSTIAWDKTWCTWTYLKYMNIFCICICILMSSSIDFLGLAPALEELYVYVYMCFMTNGTQRYGYQLNHQQLEQRPQMQVGEAGVGTLKWPPRRLQTLGCSSAQLWLVQLRCPSRNYPYPGTWRIFLLFLTVRDHGQYVPRIIQVLSPHRWPPVADGGIP